MPATKFMESWFWSRCCCLEVFQFGLLQIAGAGFALRCWLCGASADVMMEHVYIYGARLVACCRSVPLCPRLLLYRTFQIAVRAAPMCYTEKGCSDVYLYPFVERDTGPTLKNNHKPTANFRATTPRKKRQARDHNLRNAPQNRTRTRFSANPYRRPT